MLPPPISNTLNPHLSARGVLKYTRSYIVYNDLTVFTRKQAGANHIIIIMIRAYINYDANLWKSECRRYGFPLASCDCGAHGPSKTIRISHASAAEQLHLHIKYGHRARTTTVHGCLCVRVFVCTVSMRVRVRVFEPFIYDVLITGQLIITTRRIAAVAVAGGSDISNRPPTIITV